jgi:thymidylate synthase ThyX
MQNVKQNKGICAEIIADSLNPKGKRLTTFILEYPRFVHAEILTHRMFSKNAASSRAIPIEKMIQQVIDNPAMPVWWGKNQSGMQAKEELGNSDFYYWNGKDGICFDKNYESESRPINDKQLAIKIWLESRDKAIQQVKKLSELGLHKQIANRILEPWFNIRIILTGTDFENFFALRAHKDAQPEFQALAYKMLELYNNSTPKELKAGEWHIPFGDKMDIDRICKLQKSKDGIVGMYDPKWDMIKIAVARCARVSYWNFEGKDDYSKDIETCDKLFGAVPRHLSPAEHVAKALDSEEYIGNFCGFKQYRKIYADENLKDERVIKK